MAKITETSRAEFEGRRKPYKEQIDEMMKQEKTILSTLSKEGDNAPYKKIELSHLMLNAASIYMVINAISVEVLDTKNNDALNDARKLIYKAIIYIEEIVTNIVDCPFSELDDKRAQIATMTLSERYALVKKMGLSIKLLIDALGENSKWKMSFVELQGRFVVVAKNMLDMKEASKDYFDPNSENYDETVLYLRLLKKLLGQSGEQYRDKYELSTKRIDDMQNAINFIIAQRRLCIAINDKDEAEELKKKALVWKEKLEKDQKSGLAK